MLLTSFLVLSVWHQFVVNSVLSHLQKVKLLNQPLTWDITPLNKKKKITELNKGTIKHETLIRAATETMVLKSKSSKT